jgi:hypothetical protein
MRYKGPTRVLALDLHPRSFGYVVAESPDRLLDWGVRSRRRRAGSADALIRRLKPLLRLWKPAVVVLREPLRVRPLNPQKKRLLARIITAAKSQRVRVEMLKTRPTDRAEKLTKYARAQAVVKRFSILAYKLPPKRKPWESEDYRMSMFTAATLAMAQLRITNATTPAIPSSLPLCSPKLAVPRTR